MELSEHVVALPPDFWLLGENHELRTDYWTPSPLPHYAPRQAATAELAECTCPEFCERDHDND